jgi:GR25 family glycosyltransferase involved in LPS biosynthesis
MNWDYFDKCYCISVKERTDRQDQARIQFERIGLLDRVEFHRVNKHPSDCEQGIYESHMACMEKGIQAGAERILIFEDDVVFDRFSHETLENCIRFMSENKAWRMVFFGCMVRGSEKTPNPSVLKIQYRSLTHAYVIHRRFAEILIQNLWQKIPYDDYLRDLRDDHIYAAFPSFAFQSNSPSDNERYLPLDRFRRMCGGLLRLQKGNEFFHHRKTAIISGHILIILLLGVYFLGTP